MGSRASDPLVRYLAKVDQRGADECWPWTAGCFSNRYGAFRLGTRQMKAHRFGYEALVGPIAEGMFVCHRCDNRICQNPAHWFLGTHRDNAHDRERKGRGRYRTVGPLPAVEPMPRARGERHGMSKLTDATVREIRRLYSAGSSQDALARRFAVSQTAVSRIVRRTAWHHVEDGIH